MRIGLALLVQDDAQTLPDALPALTAVLRDTRPLLLIDQGSRDGSREQLQAFIRRHGGDLLALDVPLSRTDAAGLARERTGADHVVVFGARERLHRDGLERLETTLGARQPDLTVTGCGFCLPVGSTGPVPGPDAGRTADFNAPFDWHSLYPDPRRLVLYGGAAEFADPALDPARAWDIWDRAIAGAGHIHYQPEPLVMPPLPDTGAAAALGATARLVAGAPRGAPRRATLETAMLRCGDALWLAGPGEAAATITAARAMLRSLPLGLRRYAASRPGPGGALLAALRRRDEGAALAQLALLASARSDMQTLAVSRENAALRRDLDLALPGPDYLMELYARLRDI